MPTTIFDKTDNGRDEIATRANHMAPRLRTLLVLVDGKRDTVELMAKVAGLGLDEKSLVELLEGGFIQVSDGAMPVAAAIPAQPAAIALAPVQVVEAVVEAAIGPEIGPGVSVSVSTLVVPAEAPAPAMSDVSAPPTPGAASQCDIDAANLGILREGETQFQALYNFFNETIRSVIGLRGFTMQLKVERASTVADFRLLRQSYLEAVSKAKGPEMEHSLRNRLDQLLSLGE